MSKKPDSNTVAKNIANFFGGLGYLSCMLQWLWVAILYFSTIQNIVDYIAPNNSEIIQTVNSAPSSDPIFAIIAIAITILFSLIAIYVMIKLPMTIIKTSKNAVQNTAKKAAPLVIKAQGEKQTEKKRIKLTSEIVVIVKILLITTPIVLTFLSQFYSNTQLDFAISMLTAGWLTGISTILFTTQYAIAKISQIRVQSIW